ncbi:MAG: 6-pyruvoyl trahydropterin synthase family protein [Flavobacteriaceae bacterium]|jgi:6-pyruvoyltetrahydropterin/6-carboxytetrahydropterin synthase
MITTVRLTKEFTFETGHALYGYDGLCKNVHGHSYKLAVTIAGTPIDDPTNTKFGMVMDFSELKTIVKEEIVLPFDHATVLNINSPHLALADEMEKRGHKVLRVNYQPTCEMMIVAFAEKIQKRLPAHIRLISLKLRETGTAYAEWFVTDNS